MVPEIIPISLFAAIFGIIYLFLSTRNRERLALIDKGIDINIFKNYNIIYQKIIFLNLAFFLIGVGLGIFLALILVTYTSLQRGAVYPAMVFLMSGASLLIAFYITDKIDKNKQ